MRILPDGSYDSSFSGDGRVITPVGSGTSGSFAVALQTDGKIVSAGTVGPTLLAPLSSDFGVIRYNGDGSLDTTFDTDGIATTSLTAGFDVGKGVAIQADHNIIMVGSANDASPNVDTALVSYLATSTAPNLDSFIYLPAVIE